MNSAFISHLRQSVSQGQVDVTLEKLQNHLPDSYHLYDEVILLSSRYHNIEKQYRQNTLDFAVLQRERNKVCEALLQIIGKIEHNNQSGLISSTRLLTKFPPQLQPDKVFGRAQDLKRLENILSKQAPVVVINGLGGVGKSTLARLYLSHHQGKFDHIAWLPFHHSFAQTILTSTLPDNLHIARKSLNEVQVLEQAALALQALDGNNLLVIDNADDIEELNKSRHWLPLNNTHWTVLITSRGVVADGFEQLPLGTLSFDESVKLFEAHYPQATQEPKALKELLNLVGLHTLTVELMAKTLAKSRRLSNVKALLAKVKDKKYTDPKLLKEVWVAHKDKWSEGADNSNELKRKVKGIYQYLLVVLDLTELNSQEQQVIQWLAMFPTKPLAVSLFFGLVETGAREDDPWVASVDESLDALIENGWLQELSVDNEFTQSIFLHTILKDLIFFKIPPNYQTCKPLIERYPVFVKAADQPVLPRLSLVELGENLTDYFAITPEKTKGVPCFEYVKNIAHVYSASGYLHSYLGNYTQTLACHQEALRLAVELSTNDSKEHTLKQACICEFQKYLGYIQQDLGNYDIAQTLFENSLQIARSLGDLSLIASRLSNLGLLYREKDQYRQAKPLLEEALSIRLRLYGSENNLAVMVNMSNLGLVYHNLFNHWKAKPLLEKSLAYHEKHLGAKDPETVIVRSNLSQVYAALNEFDKAHKAIKAAIEAALENFGELHLHVAGGYNNWGIIYLQQGEKEPAKVCFQKALEIYRQIVVPSHPLLKEVGKWLIAVEDEQLLEDHRRLKNIKLT
ncbi:tetratricopeptide repeat protein [Microscilla marina]|uniref:FOG: TPR repeat, putative n=1 Tax=Microscilla marina ATCC 23134 TaxID=313606 RepID=A1ZU87_MICM2|nr:tetratricopeptide repeat protein [Microscilla marina]EAY26058.1 FOG: TPR repeat, putative [Microscilla marina ATCC 23134]